MKLGPIIKKWRIMEQRKAIDVAKEIGLDNSTYSRMEQGGNIDGKTLSAVLRWLLK